MRNILSHKYGLGRLPQAFLTGLGVLLATLRQSVFLSRIATLFFLCLLSVCSFAQAPSSETPAAESSQGNSEESDGPGGRESWFLRGRRGPSGEPAAELRARAYLRKMELRAHKKQMNASPVVHAAQTPPSANPQWTSLGPSPMDLNPGGNFGDYGFVVGRVTSVAVDQNDSTGNTVYVGGAYGGLWKSTNAAAADPSTVSWTPLTDNQPTLAIGAIALKPDNSQIVLVGTGEINESLDSYYGLGILRSSDGGATWSLISAADNGARSFHGIGFGRIAFSADNTSLAVAAAAETNGDGLGAVPGTSRLGLYYTLDAGLTWHLASVTDNGQPTAPDSATDVVYNRAERKFFAAIRYHGIYVSSDGINWSRLPNQPSGNALGLGVCSSAESPSCPLFRAAITVRPGADETYVWYTDGFSDLGIYQSTNGGASWTQILSPSFSSCGGDTSGCSGGTQLFYNFSIKAVPTSVGTDLYIGHVNLLKCSLSASNPTCQNNVSTTGNWLNLTHVYGCTPFGAPAHVHPDEHAIEIVEAKPDIIYFGNDGGIYRTLSASAGLVSGSCSMRNAFDNLDTNFGSMTEFVSFSVHPTDPGTLLGGTQDNGSPAVDATDSGANGVTWLAVAPGDGGYNAINPDQPLEWFIATHGANVLRCPLGIKCRATDFQPVISATQVDFDASDFYTPYILDPQNSSSILIGTCRLWRGPSSGSGWTVTNALSYNFDTNTPTVCSLSSTNIVTAIAAGGPKTSNGSQVVYVGTAVGNIFVTTNADVGPSSWVQSETSSLKGYLVSNFALDQHDASGRTAYATVMGFGVGHVFKTTDAGSNWIDISGDLPDAPADSVVVDPNDSNVIYVGSDIGVFQTLNGGTNWLDYGPSTGQGALPEVVVTQLRIFGNQMLRASTYGRGVWEIPLNTFPDFDLVVNDPTSLVLFPSQTFSFQGTLSAFNNYSSSVAISCGPSGSPPPATCLGSTVSPGLAPAPFSVSVSNPVAQDFSFSIIGTGSDASTTTHKQNVQVRVVDFNLTSPVPSTISLPRGNTTQPVILSVTASGSFSDEVTLACNGLPAGATCKFTPPSVSPSTGKPASVSLLISTSPSTPSGSSAVTIAGNTNSLLGVVTRSVGFNLTTTLNPQFVMGASPAAVHARVGEPTATTTVTISSQDGYTGTVSLSCSVAPPGPACNPLQNSFSSFPANTSLTVSANGAASGLYTLSLKGTDTGGVHSLSVPFAITDFALSGQPTAAANTGDNLTLAWTAVPLSGYMGTLNLTCDATALGAQATCSVPAMLDMSAGLLTGFGVRITVPSAASPGTYAVSLHANDGFLTHSSQLQVAVVSNSAIQATGITPQEEEDGGIPVGMTVFGKNFTPQSRVLIDGVDYNVSFPSSSTAIGVTTPTQIFNQVGIHQFSVTDPHLGTSNSVPFRIFVPNQATLSMQAPSSINMPVFFGGALDVAPGDFEKTGHQDLAVLGGQILLLHNTGNGNFAAAGQTSYQGGSAQFLLSGDLNGDGNLDLIVINQSQQAGADNNANFTVLLGDGQGHFSQSGNFPLPALPLQAALLDLNGDGKLDLLLNSGGLILLPGKGDGTFGPAITIGPGANFVIGSVNGNGSKDIILNGPGQIRIFLNNGAGSFQEVDPPELQGLTGNIIVGDFNGDGLLDLFIQGANELPGMAQVFLGLGKGSFTPRPEIPIVPSGYTYAGSPYTFVVGDFDGDGKLDLAGVNGEAHPSHALFLWGKGDGTFTSQIVVGPQSFHAKSADINGDGLTDLITIGGSLTIIPGQRNRLIGSPTALFPFSKPDLVRTGDINGDGLPDILVEPSQCFIDVDCTTSGGEVFLNQGGRAFSAPIDVPVAMRLADLNGDGLADLVGCSGANVQIWPGDGSGAFRSSPVSVPIGTSCPSDIQVVDLDRDGRLDIIGVGFILYGKGGFNFDLVPIQAGADGPVLVGDFNGDGFLDLIETSTGYILFGQPNRTFRSIFSPGGVVPASSGSSYAVADFDLDGKDDVAVANSNTIFILISQGDGTFVAKSVLTPIGIVQSLTTGDFNGDGIPDLATGLFFGPQDLVLFINDGHANFSRSSFASGAATVAITSADFNGDGKADLVYANYTVSSRPPNILVMLAGGSASPLADFTLTRGARRTQTVKAGDTADAYDLIVTPLNNTTPKVTLACEGLPAGAACQFSPANPIDTTVGPVLVSVSVPTIAGATPPGTYPFLVRGNLLSASKPADGPFSLTVTSNLPNLAIQIAPPASPPAVGNPHSYRLTISNSGAQAATGVEMQMSFSLAGSVSSATPQQGTCTLGPSVQCSLGSVAAAQTVTLDVTAVFMPDGVSPVSNPTLNVTATVTENEQDAVLADNTATLVETVGDFQLSTTPASVTVVAGQPAPYTVAAASRLGPFAAAVTFGCTGLPSQTTCTFSPMSVTPGGGSASAALTITTTSRPLAGLSPPFPQNIPSFAFAVFTFTAALLLVFSTGKRRKQFAALFFLLIVLQIVSMMGACSSGSSSPPPPPPPPPQGGTPAGTYTITLTGTSGTAQRATQFTLVVQ